MKTESQNPLPKTRLLPGAVCRQYRRCGKPNCRCATGKLHGPYYFRFWREGGKLRKQYVKRSEVATVRAACLANRDLQAQRRAEREESRQMFREMLHLLRQLGG